MKNVFACLLLLAAGALAAAQDAPLLKGPLYWFHVMNNLNNDETNVALFALMERAAKAGYTGLMIHDGRFIMRRFQTPAYRAKLKKFHDLAATLKLTIAAELTPMGYGDEILDNDVNLMEGVPVRNAAFIVKDGRLVPHEPGLRLLNGALEEWKGDAPAHWQADDPGKICFRDGAVKSEGAASLRMSDPGANEFKHARLRQSVAVQPWHNYHLSALVKTDKNQSRDLRIMALGEIPLNWTVLPIKETMDWTRVDVTFNSFERSEVGLYLGTWDGRSGTLWWDDIRLEPAGFVNLIRRESLPLSVTSDDGKISYVEGQDFSRVVDPLLVPDITAWHQPPTVSIPAGSRLREGQIVLANYHHGVTNLTENNAAVCMSEPKVYDDIRSQVAFLAANLHPDVYFLGHDEIRLCGWDDSCAKRQLTPAQILADNIAKCVAIVEQGDPGKPVVVWNDMFDPHHNAKQTEDDGSPFHMYLSKGAGAWYGSWKGMPRQLGVMNWNNGNVKSVRFFAGEGHQQILSWDDPDKMVQWLDQTKDCPGVVGVMYTTWENDWSRLEKYVQAAKRWYAQHPAK